MTHRIQNSPGNGKHAATIDPLVDGATRFAARTLRVVVIACGAMLVAACSSPPPDLGGVWKSERTTLTIAQDKNNYKIVAENPKGILGGNYTSQFRDGKLELKGPLAPLCGDMQYTDGKLNFCGEAFVRVPK